MQHRSQLASDSDSGDDEAYTELDTAAASVSVEGDAVAAAYRCLFCDYAGACDAGDLIGRHLPDEHGVRLGDFLVGAGLREQADWVRLVAFLRERKAAGAAAQQRPEEILDAWRRRLRGEDGMQDAGESPGSPTAFDDPLMYEVDIDDLLAAGASASATSARDSGNNKDSGCDKDSRIRELEEQVAALRGQVAGMSALLRRLAGGGGGDKNVEDADAEAASPLLPPPRTVAEISEVDDDYYVDSYSGASIHAEMLLDEVRTGAYHSFIAGNPALFADRLVLDVGCGSGILSMFAARSGARRVLAVDCAGVIEEAATAAADNGLSDRISFHRGKLERLPELRGADADAIVSEWMGYFLLYEGMIESVLYARDHCLRPGGSVYPRVCTLHLCGLDSPELYHRRVLYFDSVCGVRLAYLRERGLTEAHVAYDLQPDWVATDAALLRSFDLLRARPEDTRFGARVRLTASRDCTLHALAGYFDAAFLGPGDVGQNVTFSTGPLAEGGGTHWGQTVFCLRRPIPLTRGQALDLTVTVGQPEGHPRGLRVTVDLPDGGSCQYTMK